MARFIFPSIAHNNEFAYAVDTMTYARAPLHDDFQKFQTFGDGLTAHGPDYSIQDEDLIDFLESLAVYLLEHPEMANTVSHSLRSDTRKKDIDFAASIEYKDTSLNAKYQYYSAEERKVSTTNSKKNDRRYERVAQWMDGSYDAVVKILTRDYFSRWQMYLLHEDVRQWFIENREDYHALPAIKMNIAKCGDDARRINHAHEAALYALQTAEYADRARRRIEEYRRHLEDAAANQSAQDIEKVQAEIDTTNEEQAIDAN